MTMTAAVLAAPVSAQGTGPQATEQPSAATRSAGTARPATTTATGDTGLWFVPTGEIVPAGEWSFSAYRVNFDFEQGFTDVSNWPVTFGIGVRDRVEVFGALTSVNRIDRDVRPLFFPTATGILGGGVVNEYPFVTKGWTGNNIGDLWVGAKINLTSQSRLSAAAFAVRGMIKLPTATTGSGAGTGKPDVAFDAILSKEINARVELSGTWGFIVRGDPPEYDLVNGFRWGFGAGFPSRKHLRLTAELHGEARTDNLVQFKGVTIQTIDGDFAPIASEQKSPANATLGMTWLGGSGFFAGAGVNWSLGAKGRSDFGSFEDRTGDALGFQLRLGYHPGVRHIKGE
jgi:hypothetical protein